MKALLHILLLALLLNQVSECLSASTNDAKADQAESMKMMESLAQSHVEANVPPQEVFHQILIRDITAHLNTTRSNEFKVEYELLRDAPTQSGISFPKFYVWVKATGTNNTHLSGAMRVEAMNKANFAVTDFLDRQHILTETNLMVMIFPTALCGKILDHAKNEP